jgi:hypothetical protein
MLKSARRFAAAVVLTFGLLVGGSGCWFTPGHEEFVCESDADCRADEGLRCLSYGFGGKTRRQCRKPGTSSISSKSGYTTFAIYLSYGFWIGMPLFIAGAIIRDRIRTRGVAAPQQKS